MSRAAFFQGHQSFKIEAVETVPAGIQRAFDTLESSPDAMKLMIHVGDVE